MTLHLNEYYGKETGFDSMIKSKSSSFHYNNSNHVKSRSVSNYKPNWLTTSPIKLNHSSSFCRDGEILSYKGLHVKIKNILKIVTTKEDVT